MEYKGYTVEDFVMDTYFQEWVQNPTEQAEMFWEKWLLANPSQADTVAEARSLIKAMNFRCKAMPVAKADAIWNALEMSMIDNSKNRKEINPSKTQTDKVSLNNRVYLLRVAASLSAVILMAAAVFTYWKWSNTIHYTTAYGETKEIQLPDGSIVTLNANSKLSFTKNFLEADVREVWLNGEAFFSVVHTSSNQKFIVHTDDFLQVEVLGTEFNITRRNNKTRVVLETGKIQLTIQPSHKDVNYKQSLLMKPGELVEFDNDSEKYVKKEVNPEIYSSWKSNKLMLDETSLQEIIQLLESTYGYQIEIANKSLLQQKVSGSIPLGDQDTLLQYIAQTFEIKVSRKGSIVKIQPVK